MTELVLLNDAINLMGIFGFFIVIKILLIMFIEIIKEKGLSLLFILVGMLNLIYYVVWVNNETSFSTSLTLIFVLFDIVYYIYVIYRFKE